MGCVFGVCSVFFVQAEDGIRDLVRSRGLGDVYKRQGKGGGGGAVAGIGRGSGGIRVQSRGGGAEGGVGAVSYTHLTLPTSDLV